MTPAEDYLDKCSGLLDTVRGQLAAIDQAADRFAETIGNGGLVHLFGSGHSRIFVEEMWPRPHFLDEDAAVSGAEEMHEATVANRLGKPIGGLVDGGELATHGVEQAGAFVQIVFSWRHEERSLSGNE